MSGWLQDGKSAIHEAVEDAFHRIEASAKSKLSECDRRNDVLLRELQQLQGHAANVAQLQQENESLRRQVQELLKAQESAREAPAERRIPLGELSPNKFPASTTADPPSRLGPEVVDYERECKKLHTKCNNLEKSRDRYKSVLRQRTEQIDKWAEASDKQKAIIDRLRMRLAQYQSRGPRGTCADTADLGTPTDDERFNARVDKPNRQIPPLGFGNTPSAAPGPSIALAPAKHAVVVAHCDAGRPEDLTEDVLDASAPGSGPAVEQLELPKLPDQEHNSGIALKVELSSDGPIFVSERAVHKRKRDRGGEPKSKHAQNIKSEHGSSEPECTGETHVFTPTESLDFDQDVHVPTPKKPRLFAKAQLYTGDDVRGARVTGSSLNDTHTPAAPGNSLPKLTISHGDGHDLDNTPTSREPVARISELVTPGGRQQQKHAVFQLGQGIRGLAEDGDVDWTTVQRRVAKGRLDALLNSPSLRTPMTKIQPVSHIMNSLQHPAEDDDEADLRVPAPRELPHGKKLQSKDTPATPMQRKAAAALPTKAHLGQERAAKRPSILREGMTPGRPTDREGGPLRRKPMETLRPEDFKPNPGYNDGLTYVYGEVVRGRQARSALSGCTDLNCCGKTFRSFAKAERSTIGPSVTTRAEDIKLLEEYLGDDAYKLGTLTRDEKEETWLLAKTWELATKFGRHRQRYSRMPSPPGYWTVEFPSTQERAEERRQAEEIQKALVKERYREAMRPGGRWLFRDEEGR
ncbi:hypothetical protein KVR01_001914 [Diaporthe batatas]|uniref:uncharacterized protein n=1 Tax=Diaporthe batatas TaxID=748121 RepID=UPI001D056EC1|nr:uncharacterized protein KVR01_001914 [Diaporthe batatas]KAG8169165.1 hypothetical protein KVR01_001914 [Diaporthe batatas]